MKKNSLPKVSLLCGTALVVIAIDSLKRKSNNKKNENENLELFQKYLSYSKTFDTGRRITRNVTNIKVVNPNLNHIYLQGSINKFIIDKNYLDNFIDDVSNYPPLVLDGYVGEKTISALCNFINKLLIENKNDIPHFELITSPYTIEGIRKQSVSDYHWERITNRSINSLVSVDENINTGKNIAEVKDNLFTRNLEYVFPYIIRFNRDLALYLEEYFRLEGIGIDQQTE